MADNILRLRVDSQEYDAKLKKAAEGIRHLADVAHQSGGELTGLEKAELDYVKALGSMETKSRTAAGSVRELESTYKELTVVYNHLSDSEKQDEGGKALRASLDQIKQRAREGKNELESINQELGNTKTSAIDAKSVIQELGSRFGVSSDLLGSLTTGTVAYTAAIGAAATAVAAATKQWAEYNAELARQDQVTTVTTGLKGDDAERMTSSMRALSRTYDVDFRDAVNAANTLMTQFGKSGDEAIQLLRDGMQGMIQGDGPKMLSMIQQYAPAFRDAGISASQLIAVIQNSEGGIFTDQNMNAIVMGIKNIRLMTKATSDALAKLGIDGQKMSQQLSNGSLTIFDALKQVATAIQGVGSSSKAAGEVMQQVFGRQGAMAGTKLGEAIATLNIDLEQTKKQTGEVGESFVKLQQANERLEVAIRECFGYDGYQQLAQGIKTQLVTALASTLEMTMKIKDSWAGDVAGGIFEKMTDAALRLMGPLGSVLATLKEIAGIGGNGGGTTPSNPEVDKMLKYIGEGGTRQERQRRYGQQINSINRQIDSLGQERTRVDADGSTSYYKLSPAKQKQYREALERQKTDLQSRAISVIIGSQQESPGAPVIKPINTDKPVKKTKQEKEQTELQKNQAKINTLTQQFVDINAEASRAGKPLTEEQKKQTEEIQKQIEALKQRNGLLNRFAEQAQGRLLSNDDIKRKAEIDMQVNTKQIEDLRKQLAEIDGVTIDPKAVTITATDEALPKLREIEGITIDDKTMTVTAETADALRALQGIEGVAIDPKTVTITATDEALPKLRDIEGITIDDKTMTVTANTSDALKALQGIEGVAIDPKTIDVNANTSEAQQKIDELKAKIAELEDKNINIKAFIDNVGKPLGEQQLSNTPGTLLKAPTTAVYEDGVKSEKAVPSGGLLLDDKAMKAVQKNIDDSLPKAEKKESPMDSSKKMLNAISQLTGGLQQMGIELPSEIQSVIGVIQGVMSVIEAVDTIIGVTQTTALTANTAAMISLEAALWANTATSLIPFANGGIVPGFANGGVIDSGHSPSFLSFSKAAPSFATGGVVEAGHAPDFISFSKAAPAFAIGGVVPQTFTSLPKFNEGGTVEAGHAPDFLSFSKAMPKFATGGTIPHANSGYFVGGTHFSGDVTPIMANAGELVLNKAQQGNLASQLQGSGMQNLNLTATIKGEQIRLALNNNGRRTGRGEYVQSSNRV